MTLEIHGRKYYQITAKMTSEVWENLSKSYLIDLIGEENLEFAEEILPELAREIGRDYNDFINITNKKSKSLRL